MKASRLLLSALAGFIVFAPATFLWHTLLFVNFYIGPTYSVKSPEGLSPGFLAAALAVLMLGMAAFVPNVLGPANRLRNGAIVGSLFTSMVVDFHSLFLNGLFPGLDPASLYLMDALWALIFGAIAGLIVVAVHDRLGRASPELAARR